MIPGHCRHLTYLTGPDWEAPIECEAGVKYRDLPERNALRHRCWGRNPKAFCSQVADWTEEELEAQRQLNARIDAALVDGRCHECNKELVRSGVRLYCPDGHFVAYDCAPSDAPRGVPR